jgi:energy-coupling factor transport system ATP-binding protein
LIQIENLSYTYPTGVQALKGVSLGIRDGEFLAIMGENGAGKTTLVKHLNGLLKPSSGRVLVDGVDTREASVATLSRTVGLVFQNPDDQLFSETSEDEVSFALKNFGFSKEVMEKRVNWALNLLGLERYRKVSPLMLSGGERKRLALASVLAWDPKVVVLDEPTVGQDHSQKQILRQFIIQLNTQGKTVIIVTHDVEFVAECAPKVVVMSRGKVITEGEARRVLCDESILSQASIIPPQVAQVFSMLQDLGFPRNVINVEDAKGIIAAKVRARRL